MSVDGHREPVHQGACSVGLPRTWWGPASPHRLDWSYHPALGCQPGQMSSASFGRAAVDNASPKPNRWYRHEPSAVAWCRRRIHRSHR